MHKAVILAMDIGNTRTHCGCFYNGKLQWTRFVPTSGLPEALDTVVRQIDSESDLRVGWMSVARKLDVKKWSVWNHFDNRPSIISIHSMMRFPIANLYESPETLGTDRIVAVIGALSQLKKGPVLVIDAGTALTYDVADQNGAYLGGAIGPGIYMRLNALHNQTAGLPLVEAKMDVDLIGKTTVQSILAGVILGVRAEMKEMIKAYKKKLGPDLQVVITGGDLDFFENQLENINFADANLNLRGIYYILSV